MNEIKLDERNARKHEFRNKETIKASLKDLGSGRSILIDKNDVVIAGNGVYDEASKLGLKVRIIESDGTELIAVKRTDLGTEDQKRKLLALADNRTSDLSEWDQQKFEELIAELPEIELETLAFNKVDIEKILGKHLGQNSVDDEWQGMPDFNQPEQSAYKEIKVSFMNKSDYEDFAKLIAQNLTEQTKSIWFPKQFFNQTNSGKVYTDEQS